jgi:hypothetical protein
LQSEIDAAQEELLKSLTPERRSDVEFFIRNGGAETHVLGFPLRLGKMDETLSHVIWYQPRKRRTMRFSIGDSMRLLSMPYRRAGRQRYFYPKITGTGRFTLPDRIVFLYAELCQDSTYAVKRSNAYLHMSWTEYEHAAEIAYHNGSFELTDEKLRHVGWFSDYGDVYAQKRRIPVLLDQHLRKTRPKGPEETAE